MFYLGVRQGKPNLYIGLLLFNVKFVDPLSMLQGDFHHWIDLFNHFDLFFDKHVKSRKDLQLEGNFLARDPPFPKAAVLQILRTIRIILENCANKHFYGSYEVHDSVFNYVLNILSCQ